MAAERSREQRLVEWIAPVVAAVMFVGTIFAEPLGLSWEYVIGGAILFVGFFVGFILIAAFSELIDLLKELAEERAKL